jgi:hypothetical protein
MQRFHRMRLQSFTCDIRTPRFLRNLAKAETPNHYQGVKIRSQLNPELALKAWVNPTPMRGDSADVILDFPEV